MSRRRFAVGVAFALAALAAPLAPGRAQAPPEGRLVLDGGFVSAALAATSAVGGEVRYAAYLPPGYEVAEDPAGAPARYPVLYLLHGSGGSETDWLFYGDLQVTLDRLIGTGELPPLIVVMPGDRPVWYTDPDDRQQALERFLSEELIAHVDASYRTRPEAAARFVAGVSLGGYHAVYQALKHPDRFAAAASLSGPFWTPSPTAFRRTTLLSWFFGDFETAAAHSVYTVMAYDGSGPAVYLLAGDDDGFLAATLELYLAMREAELPAELRVVEGGHGWRVWRREAEGVLRFFGERLGGG